MSAVLGDDGRLPVLIAEPTARDAREISGIVVIHQHPVDEDRRMPPGVAEYEFPVNETSKVLVKSTQLADKPPVMHEDAQVDEVA